MQARLSGLQVRFSGVQVRLLGVQARLSGGAGEGGRAWWGAAVPVPALMEVSPQIKTWFQNRRMKHKRQLQDSQLSSPFPGGLHPPVTFCPPPPALRRPLRLLCPWAPPLGPPALGQPPGPFWDLCRVDRASVALAWASCSRQPPTCCLPDPGGQELGPALALSGVPRGLCALPQTGDAF